MRTSSPLLVAVILSASLGFGQAAPTSAPGSAAGANTPATTSATAAPRKTPDKSEAYYHYSLGHIYEELATMYGRSEYANQAIEEYRLAIENDPSSNYLNSALAELYAKTGRIRDAVLEAQEIISKDPGNLEARRLLGRIYLRSMGDVQAGNASAEVLKRAIEQYEAIVKLQPDSVEDHLLLGRLYRLNDQQDKAEAEFKTAVKLQPFSEEAVTTLAYLYNEQGKAPQAAQILGGIPEPDRSARLYSALGYTYEQEKNYKQAIVAYRKAVELDHDNLDAMRGLAQNLINDGQNDAALQQYKIITDADPQDAQSYLRMAEIYRRNGNFDQALAALQKAQSFVQDSLEVSYNIALVYQAQGRFDDAAQILQDLVQKSEKADGNYSSGERNNRSIFLERLGGLYRDDDKYQQAIDTFKKMFVLGDDSMSRGYQEIVDTYRDAKMWPQATAAAQEAVTKLPNDRNLKLTLAAQEADSGNYDKAVSQIKALLHSNAEDRDLYLTLAQISSRAKRYKQAEEYVQKAEQLSTKPEEREYAWFIWGSIYERQKKYDPAEEMFKKSLGTDQRNPMVLNYLGYMLADRGVRLEEALGYIKKAVQLDPQNGAYLDSLGWAYYKLGDYDLAEANLRRASERMSTDPTVQDHLGELYAKTGRLRLAAAHWERALQEWNRSVPAEIDQDDVQKVQKKLESAKMKLARQQERKAADANKP